VIPLGLNRTTLFTLVTCWTTAMPLAAQADDFEKLAEWLTFADGLPEQEAQLAANPLLLRFREARRKRAGDPFRPAYHFTGREGPLNDPNGLCRWQGRWHFFYQVRPPEDGR
jgi:beta-fructofuranosidase